MRVGIDARRTERADDRRGIAVIIHAIVEELLRRDTETFLFYSSRPDDRPRSPRAHAVVLRPRFAPIWEQLVLPVALMKRRIDLYHAAANIGVPLFGKGVFIATVNDVIPLVTPYLFDSRPDPPLTTWLFRLAYRISMGIVVWKARRVITLSECSRRDIERLFPRARGKVTVISPGPDPRYRRVEDAGEVKRIAQRHGVPPRFLLNTGGMGQRKNIPGLLRAYALLVDRLSDVPTLVITGKHSALYDSFRQLTLTLGIADRVLFPGFIPTEDMPALLSAAEFLVYPSFYEGFGLPVVEAMACGCPVICAGNSSLPEVGGDAVLYCDPASASDIAEKMERLLLDRDLRAQLIERGVRRAQEFSMERMVEGTLRLYQEVLDTR
jgi:glycosyltransferase involved in cell wall biosynthesis